MTGLTMSSITTRYQVLPSTQMADRYAVVDNNRAEPNEVCDLCTREDTIMIARLLEAAAHG